MWKRVCGEKRELLAEEFFFHSQKYHPVTAIGIYIMLYGTAHRIRVLILYIYIYIWLILRFYFFFPFTRQIYNNPDCISRDPPRLLLKIVYGSRFVTGSRWFLHRSRQTTFYRYPRIYSPRRHFTITFGKRLRCTRK